MASLLQRFFGGVGAKLERLEVSQVKPIDFVSHEVFAKESENSLYIGGAPRGLQMVAVTIPTGRELFLRIRGMW